MRTDYFVVSVSVLCLVEETQYILSDTAELKSLNTISQPLLGFYSIIASNT